jgi:hypothetical protein
MFCHFNVCFLLLHNSWFAYLRPPVMLFVCRYLSVAAASNFLLSDGAKIIQQT